MTKVNKLQTCERKFDWEARLKELVRGWGEILFLQAHVRASKAHTSITYRNERIAMTARMLRKQPEYAAHLYTKQGAHLIFVRGDKMEITGAFGEGHSIQTHKQLYQLLERKLHTHLTDWLCADILAQGDDNYSYRNDL